ncbi:hypothetical protein AWR27_09020 [Spirosoma montaniterrae]|uniref:Glycosyltransferase RgtA/B/C/D-like domain-containing protein n=1 Tax=Spirosoma montaniterrae TaxID=1178516 RepID=A0A1P9WVN6_9BACT|nr:hypothetical protein AWR27_09020 [Spirosoma montaniterrae]
MFGAWHHEPWRDETHSWLIAQHSSSIADLFWNKRYEGHPGGWYVLLYGLKSLSQSWVAVQVMHGLLAMGSAYLLITRSSFPWVVRVLLLFGYFFVYEYAVIARNYAVGVLLLFGLCALFPRRYERGVHIGWCLLLALLWQTNLFALLLGLGMYGLFWLELLIYRQDVWKTNWPYYVGGAILAGGSLLLTYIDLLPPDDLSFPMVVHGDRSLFNALATLYSLKQALLPLPDSFHHFWNGDLLDIIGNKTNKTIQGAIGLSLLAAMGYAIILPLFRSRLALLGWVLICLAIQIVLFSQYRGSLRHHGHQFLALIICLWIQPYLADLRPKPLVLKRNETLAYRLVPVVLGVHILTTVVALLADWQYPFSMARATAQYIRQSPQRDWFRAGHTYYAVENVAAHLPDFRMYYPTAKQHNGFIMWRVNNGLPSLTIATNMTKEVGRKPALLVFSGYLSNDSARYLGLKPIISFKGSIVTDEQFWLFAYPADSLPPRLPARPIRASVAQQ